MNVSKNLLGRSVEANWGAYFPVDEGLITDINEEEGTVFIQFQNGANIDPSWIEVDKIHAQGWRSPNGSPIGVFWQCN